MTKHILTCWKSIANWSKSGVFASVVWLLVAILSHELNAQHVDEQAVESGRKSLKRAANFPWYEESQDDLRDIELPATVPPIKPANWQKKTQKVNRNWNLDGFWQVVQYVVWCVLAAFLIGSLFFLPRWITNKKRYSDQDDDELTDEHRIAQLPFPVTKPLGDLLSNAERLRAAGNYREAIVYLYSYKLVQLDKAHLIRLTKGKTNRQYLTELRSASGLKGILSRTMLVFEEVFFGQYDLSKESFEECWNQLDEFRNLLKTAMVT